jgi:hypothetical protein
MLSGSSPTTSLSVEMLIERFAAGNPRQRRPLIKTIESRVDDLVTLDASELLPFDPKGDDWAPGWILQVIQRHRPAALSELLKGSTAGWLSVESAMGLDFVALQRDLLNQDFEAADRLTSCMLRELAGDAAVQRGYVYFSEVPAMQGVDLVSIDRLWTVYSQGRFGFTSQGKVVNHLGWSL